MSLCACVILKRTGKQTKIYGAASYQARRKAQGIFV